MLAAGKRILESAAIEPRQSAKRHRRVLALLTLCVCTAAAGAPADSPDAAQAKAKLAAVRQRIAELTGRLGAELKQRDALSSRLRDADLAITVQRRRLESLTAAEAAVERQRNELNAEEAHNRAALEAERASLAAQVRAQYMIGRADEMRLLLSQTNPAEAGRMVNYYGYFARLRAARIEEIDARETRVAQLQADVERTSASLKSLQDEASREVAGLVRARQERTGAIQALSEQVQSGNEQLARLKQEEQAIESLVADLERVLKDFPVESGLSFAELRGKLPWPVSGKMTVRYQETRDHGAPSAVRLNGVMIETTRGAKVHAPCAGRVVYADWLQGMGLLMIIAHSGNFMTLYGHAEVLYKSVGDWVAPGDVIGAVSDAGGTVPQLYFEIREGRKPVDPKAWLKSTQ
jgi:septal ring factor EnvC (AmiA/AmiB activator)